MNSLKLYFLTIFSVVTLCANAQKYSAAGMHSLSICSDSTVRAWGNGNSGELGQGTSTSSSTPVQCTGLSSMIAVSGGWEHSLALKSNGTVWSFGMNFQGELGNGTTTSSNVAVPVSFLTGVTAIGAGRLYSIALRNNGTVWAWGNNGNNELGNGTSGGTSLTPIQVTGLSGIIKIAAAGYHSLALKSDGTVHCWGENAFGDLGNGTTTTPTSAVQTTGLTGITDIAGGDDHSVALKNNGTVWGWGDNMYGEVGDGTTTNRNVPVQVAGLTGIIAVSSGSNFTLALKSNGTVWSWGYNGEGELGNGTTTNSNVPVQVSGLSGIVSIQGGMEHSLAMKNDGTLWAWGANTQGDLGDGTTTMRTTPVQVAALCTPAPTCSAYFVLYPDSVNLHHYFAINGSSGNGPLTYLWSWGDGNTDNIAFPTHTYANTGLYNICLTITDSTGCSSTFCDSSFNVMRTTNTMAYINVIGSTGIIDPNQSPFISIYPNPTTNNITIETAEKAVIEISNIEGQLLKRLEIKDNHLTVDISDFSSGIYFIKATTDKGITIKKLMKD